MAESNQKQTLAQWELERSLMVKGDVDTEEEMTGEEFMAKAQEQGYLGVAIEARREWLANNDHEVTRENMMDDTLTVKEPETTDESEADGDSATESEEGTK